MPRTLISIPLDDLTAALEENNFGTGNNGFCLACGEQAFDVEPDARKYHCESCGENMVFGAEEVLVMGAYK